MKALNTIIVLLVVSFSLWVTVKYTTSASIFYGDSLGYYSYLPAFFIYGNLDEIQEVKNVETVSEVAKVNINSWNDHYAKNKEGNIIIQYTYGAAAMNAPFFLIAHVIEKVMGRPASGYSTTYEWGIRVGNYIYTFLGLWMMYLLGFKLRFDKQLTFFVVAAMFWGTNLWWFTVYQSGMAHINMFFLIVLLVYLSDNYWGSPSKMKLLVLGFILGMITVIRPTDIIFGLIPLLYGVVDKVTWKKRLKILKTNGWKIALIGFIGFVIPVIPQLLYWKLLTGQYIYYSYSEQGFNWWRPELYRGLLGPNNGWLTYNPMLIIPFVALFIPKMKSPLKWTAYLLVPLYIYIIYSWWCYYYINGFGSRPMIHLYPILCLSFLAALSVRSRLLQRIVITITILLGLVNINYSFKELNDWLYSDESYHAFNFHTFFKMGIDYEDLILRDAGIAQPNLVDEVRIDAFNIDKSQPIVFKEEYGQVSLEHVLTEEDLKKDYLKVGGEFMLPYVAYSTYEHHMLVINITRDEKKLVWKAIKLNNKIGKELGDVSTIHSYNSQVWGEVFLKYPLKNLRIGDKVKAHFWNPKMKELHIRSFEMFLGDKAN